MKTKAFYFVVNLLFRRGICGGVLIALLQAFFNPDTALATTYALGTTTVLEGPTLGSDSVILGVTPETDGWTASANSPWLHLTTASGTGSTNVIFLYDPNPGATRTGTLTIGARTLTVTQAGATYVAVRDVTPLVVSGLNKLADIAVDGLGNIYAGDVANSSVGEVKKWAPANNTVTVLFGLAGLAPAIAVDAGGNVDFAGSGFIGLWTAADNYAYARIPGLMRPEAVAVDSAGNVYFTDLYTNSIMKWTASASGPFITTLYSAPGSLTGIALDGLHNLYFADTATKSIKKWTAANGMVTTLISMGLSSPQRIAIDGSGNLYVADNSNNAIMKWTAASNTLTALSSSGLNGPAGVAVDVAGNVYIGDTGNGAIKELPHAFVDTTSKWESAGAGSDVLPVVLPATANLLPPFGPTSDQPWLTVSGCTNGVVGFAFSENKGAERTAHIILLGQTIFVTQQAASLFLGATALLEGPQAGSDSVVLAATLQTTYWTASTNAAWLHLSAANQSGMGSTNVVFSYDANSGPTRTGTLNIGGQILTVTQAGSPYVAVPGSATALVSSGLMSPAAVAVDNAGNVYIADTQNNAIKKWTPTDNSVTTLVSSLSHPGGVAVDGAGNVYIADTGNNAIKKWSMANNSVTSLVSSGLASPQGIAVDSSGNVYIADTGNNVIRKWMAANNLLITPISSGLSSPEGIAIDGAGNVYIANAGVNTILKWTSANNLLAPLISSGLNAASGVAVDGAGNVYIADTGNNTISKWTAANSLVSTLASSGLNSPSGLAVDSAGNVYIADSDNNAIRELPRAFVDATDKSENGIGGSDVLPVVLPATVNLLAPFAPTSDQSWLSISGTSNGIVNFTFTGNIASGNNRTAYLTVLGQSVSITELNFPYLLGTTACMEGATAGADSVVLTVNPQSASWTASANNGWLHLSAANQSGTGSQSVVFTYDANSGPTRSGTLTVAGLTFTVTQMPPPFYLCAPSLLEGPTAGSDSVVLAQSDATQAWTATAVDSWLHLSPDNQGGTSSANVVFSYDANPGPTRTGTLTIGGQTLTVTQAGSSYVAAPIVPALVSSGLSRPMAVAVDAAGNVYIADTSHNAIRKWTLTNNSVTTVTPPGLNAPYGVAVDGAGNIYIADTGNNAIKKWTATNNTMTTLISSGLNAPYGVAVDGAGNVYIADTSNNAIRKWSAADGTVTTVTSSGLNSPWAVAVDGAGNVYIADHNNNAIKKWTAANGNLTTIISASAPYGVAVDGSGKVYFSRSYVTPGYPYYFSYATLQKWTPADNALTTLTSYGAKGTFSCIWGVAVDPAGNVYMADSLHNAIYELPHAFVDPTVKSENAGAGSDVLSPVLPVTANLLAPFAPASDQSWLTVSGISNGVVKFNFSANSGTARTSYITVLGQTIPITQTNFPPISQISISHISLSGTNLVISGTSTGSGTCYVMTSTNLARPLNQWQPLATNFVNGSGSFSLTATNAMSANRPQQFFILTTSH